MLYWPEPRMEEIKKDLLKSAILSVFAIGTVLTIYFLRR